ncbi:MAG: Mur ligase family protein [bacterium]|nr:Mur ligase family protein [bacterium]
MMSLFERIAWYRAEQYLARYKQYGIAVAGSFGREIALDAIFSALKFHRHVRKGYAVEHSIDIPEGILGIKKRGKYRGIMRFLMRSKIQELTQFEPDTIITQLPLIQPGLAPWVASRVLPRMLVFTHTGLERIDLFVSKEMILHEYLALANTLQRDAVVVLNSDDKSLRTIQEKIDRPVITYGIHPKADIRISRAVRSENNMGLFLEVVVHGVHEELFLPNLFAAQHVNAVAAAIAAAHGLGVSVKDAIHGLRTMQPPYGNLSRISGINGSSIIDDSINTCPEQLASSLKSFATLQCTGKKIIVLGDMDNLASLGISCHEDAGKQASEIAPMIIFIGDIMRHAQDAALKSGNNVDTHHFETSTEAAAWLPEYIREGDMVFISGGKSMSMGKIVKQLRAK